MKELVGRLLCRLGYHKFDLTASHVHERQWPGWTCATLHACVRPHCLRGHKRIDNWAKECPTCQKEFEQMAQAPVSRPEPVFSPIEEDDDHMTLSDWFDCCEAGGFIDYDGYGDLATATQCSDISISPSQRKTMKMPEWATHIVWYNR